MAHQTTLPSSGRRTIQVGTRGIEFAHRRGQSARFARDRIHRIDNGDDGGPVAVIRTQSAIRIRGETNDGTGTFHYLPRGVDG